MEIRNNILVSIGDADIINGKFTVPEEVTKIGENVFENRSDLIELNAQNVEVIGASAFYNCKNLKKVIMPNLEYINFYAFDNCISLPCPNDKIKREIYELTLKYLYEDNLNGLCYSINAAIRDAIIKYKQAICLQTCFPLFTYENAVKKFGATGRRGCFWWLLKNREIRKDFLQWCYENKK